MSTVELRAELFREMNPLLDNDTAMEKLLKYVKKLTSKKVAMDETEYLMSSPRMAEILREGEKEIAEGNFTPIAIEDLWK